MEKIVKVFCNASPLIFLAKIDKLELLKKLFREIIIPQEVYDEVMLKGKKEGDFDALKVERGIKEKWIIIKDITSKEEIKKLINEIDEGEAALIVLAKKEKADLILIDDASARAIAEGFGFNVGGTLFVLLLGCKEKLLSKEEARKLIKNLIENNFRMSAELYSDILDKIERL